MLFMEKQKQNDPKPAPDGASFSDFSAMLEDAFAGSGHQYVLDVSREYGKLLPLPKVPNEKFLNRTPKNGIQGLFNYVFIYGDFADPFHSGRGNQTDDENDGIYHLHLGRDRGIVKNISFSKNNIPYHRESRMFNQGQAGLLQLSAVYDCEIKMLGNTLFLPGMEVFVNPYGFGGPAFGKVQDPPLKWSPSVAMIDSVNKQIDDASADGSIDEGERSVITGKISNIESTVNETKAKAAKALENQALGIEDKNTKLLEINSYANVMGIGGYQLIIRIKCSIKPGSFETIVNAKHTYTGYPAIKQANRFMDYRNGQPSDITDADGDGTVGCADIIGSVNRSVT